MKSISTQVYEHEWNVIKQVAEKNGMDTPTAFVRRIVRSIIRCASNENEADVMIHVTNLRELKAYAEQKRFGSIGALMTYATENFMTRNALTPAQKERVNA